MGGPGSGRRPTGRVSKKKKKPTNTITQILSRNRRLRSKKSSVDT